MELKFVVPNMEKTFGNLEYAGESEVVQRRINGRMTAVYRRGLQNRHERVYKLYPAGR